MHSQCTASAQQVHSQCTVNALSVYCQCTVSKISAPSQSTVRTSCCIAHAQSMHSQCSVSVQSMVVDLSRVSPMISAVLNVFMRMHACARVRAQLGTETQARAHAHSHLAVRWPVVALRLFHKCRCTSTMHGWRLGCELHFAQRGAPVIEAVWVVRGSACQDFLICNVPLICHVPWICSAQAACPINQGEVRAFPVRPQPRRPGQCYTY